jgi:putative FmdB family regulatory protein
MPTYVYECTACGHPFELFQKMSDPPVQTCPQCGGAVNRLPGGGAGIIFKGSGFYATDYRSREYKEKTKSESGSKGASGGGSAAKESAPKDSAAKAKDTPPKDARKSEH